MYESGSGDAGRGKGRSRGSGSTSAVLQTPAPGQAAASESAPSPQSKKALRKPNQETLQRLNASKEREHDKAIQNIVQNTEGLPVAKPEFKFDVNAPVFVPRSTTQQASPAPVVIDNSVNAVTNEEDPNMLALNNLVYTLDMLIGNPGNFSDLMDLLVQDLSQNITNEEALAQLVEIVFEKGISEPNFQYMAAKICNHFSGHFQFTIHTEHNFRHLLLKRCQQEFKNKELTMQQGLEMRICGFAMFLAELFVNMKVNNDYMGFLITPLHGLLDFLLSHPSNETFKCVSMVLKLSGGALDDCDQEQMTSLMSKIQTKARVDTVKPHIVEMLLSLLKLRNSNWGRAESPSASSDNTANVIKAQYPYDQFDPVFYNAQGKTISRQEAKKKKVPTATLR